MSECVVVKLNKGCVAFCNPSNDSISVPLIHGEHRASEHTYYAVRSSADVELGTLLFGPRQDVGARLPAQRVEFLTLCLRRRAEARA